MASPNKHPVVQELVAGNGRFLSGDSIQTAKNSLARLEDLARNGQTPKAVILCCSDSRGPAEMIFDQDIGDLFVIRVAGNIVAPSLVGSVEYSINQLGTEVVVVMGHSHCGAVTATLSHITNPQEISSENIHDIVSRIKPHIFTIAQMKDMPYEEKLALSVEANVRASVNQLSHSSRLIEGLVQSGKLTIAGAVLDLLSGKVDFIEL
jgi:carbonic anhydrase